MKQQPIGRKLLASCLALFVIGATVIPPLLDAGEDQHETRFESEHDPATCAVLHDHAACTQLARSFSETAMMAQATVRPHVVEHAGRVLDAMARPLRTYCPSPSPRAPPILT